MKTKTPRAKKAPKKKQDSGFESYLARLFAQYRGQGRARIEKVDPPSITIRGKTILKENPWVDYAGVWTEKGGRSLVLEAKHTETPTLDIARHGGVTPRQWEELRAWAASGAATAILWQYGDTIKVVTLAICEAALLETGRVSLRWCDVPAAVRGSAYAQFDVLTTLAAFDV